MGRATCLLTLTLVLAAAGCAGDEQPAAPADPDRPVQAPARTADPGTPPPDPEACERLAERLPGRSLGRAEALARKRRCGLRVVTRDGVDLPVTEDFSPSRINVAVEDRVVVEVIGLF